MLEACQARQARLVGPQTADAARACMLLGAGSCGEGQARDLAGQAASGLQVRGWAQSFLLQAEAGCI